MAAEQNLACPICGAEFDTSEHLEEHSQHAHEMRRPGQSRCPDCGMEFESPEDLEEHRRRVHSMREVR